MKGFTRAQPLFSLCGLQCGLCSMYQGGHCPGCGGGAGNQSCAIARCSLQHGGVPFCTQCPEYPCGSYADFDQADSFVPHSARQRDLARAEEMGLEPFCRQMQQKMQLFAQLMQSFDDGRHKTLFLLAAYLLECSSLQAAVEALRQYPGIFDLPARQRAAIAQERLQQLAAEQGVELKLRKAKKSGS